VWGFMCERSGKTHSVNILVAKTAKVAIVYFSLSLWLLQYEHLSWGHCTIRPYLWYFRILVTGNIYWTVLSYERTGAHKTCNRPIRIFPSEPYWISYQFKEQIKTNILMLNSRGFDRNSMTKSYKQKNSFLIITLINDACIIGSIS
jgi:hypothetical protein